MKNIVYLLVITSILTLSTWAVSAQTAPLAFTLKSNLASFEQRQTIVTSTVKRNGNLLTWEQTNQGVSTTTVFHINNTIENWDPQTSTGNIGLAMSLNGAPVDFNLQSNAQGITAAIIMNPNTSDEDIYILNINQVLYQ
ncbi:hypothetical protein [Seonamhaeicola sp.]|uniref:hypothetical protein n=1 Tax=Seonamhaeicola sp. TaxID=1912245 RepID=UPI0026110DCE|nr:hypothetical protein [Seonamhaeicola sp.]